MSNRRTAFLRKIVQKNCKDYTCSNHYSRLPIELKIGTRRNQKTDAAKIISLWKKIATITEDKIDYLLNDYN